MNIDSYGLVSLSSDEIFELLYKQGVDDLKDIYTDEFTALRFNQSKQTNGDNFGNIIAYNKPSIDIAEFDKRNQMNWFIPEDYKNLDIISWLKQQCTTQEEIIRVNQELELFEKYKMIDVLKYLKYLVDTMRSNQIVWGVGRGSSVASFCLYLLGVHRINSLTYNLDINEFLK